jgi:hypothetical protein
MVDIKRILTNHNVEFVEFGPNTGKGEVSIACPLCRDDPSHHLGLNLTTGYWHCWRNPRHSGKNLARILSILGIFLIEDKSEAMQKLLTRTYFDPPAEIELDDEIKVTSLPMEFIQIHEDTVLSRPYLKYLQLRGFHNPTQVSKDYDLRRSIMADKWSSRLIIPIYVGDEVCWTARSIGSNPLRYLSPKAGECRNIKKCLWNFNDLAHSEGEALVICEGPLDAMKIDWYTDKHIRATCLFGMGVSDTQLNLLYQLCPNYNTILIGLDQGTLVQSLTLTRAMGKYSPIIMNLGDHKDFGEMKPMEITILINKYLENI